MLEHSELLLSRLSIHFAGEKQMSEKARDLREKLADGKAANGERRDLWESYLLSVFVKTHRIVQFSRHFRFAYDS